MASYPGGEERIRRENAMAIVYLHLTKTLDRKPTDDEAKEFVAEDIDLFYLVMEGNWEGVNAYLNKVED